MPAGLLQVIDKMMAKDPAQRYQTDAAVVAALEPWCHARTQTSDRPRRRHAIWQQFRRPRTVAVAVGAVLVLVAAAVAYLVFGGSEPSKRQPPPGPVLLTKPADHELQGGNPAPDPTPDVKKGDPAPDLSGVKPLIDDDFSDPENCHFGIAPRNDLRDISIENGRYIMRAFKSPQYPVNRFDARMSGKRCRVTSRVR